jgi:GntR family transcriptional repressor for pyruvate dehydrogenase complex
MRRSKSIYKTIKQKRLSGEVTNQITDLILQNHLQPGDKLPPERQLAEELGVSRTVLREAMKALEEKGLVEVKQGSGTFVCSPSFEMVSDSLSLLLQANMPRYLELMDVREILDVAIAGRLAEGATREDIDKLSERIAWMWQVLDSPEEFVEGDVAFHIEFYQAAKNEVLLTIMQPVMELLVEAMEMTFEPPGSAESSLRRHEKLVECIRAGDAKGARNAMGEIISRGKERLKEALKAKGIPYER